MEKSAKRYARALFELTKPDDLDAERKVLDDFSANYSKSGELQTALSNPAYPVLQRIEALRAILATLGASERVKNLSSLLVENTRLSLLRDIATQFGRFVDDLKKVLALEITSAREVPEDERRTTLEKVQRDFGQLATISWKVDGALLGGMVVKSGDRLYDGSVQGRLSQIRTHLMASSS